MNKTIVYVAHPYMGKSGLPEEIKDNMKSVTEVCRNIVKNYPDVTIVSPVHNYSFFNTEDDQEDIINRCYELLDMCDEIWFFGDWTNSSGCIKEYTFAKINDIPIKIYSKKIEGLI